MLVYPEPPEESTCVLLFVPVELVPIIGAQLGQLEQRHKWATVEDWQQGYRAFVDLQAQLMSNCIATLIQEIRDLRGLKTAYASVPIEDRTSDMYRSIDDVAEKINTLIFYIGGGAEHGDNIMEILRGTEEATEERNLLEMLE